MADTSSGGERQQRGHPKAESGERAELDRQGEAGREASHGMSETFCSACSSQVGRLPMARQKPPRCSPALRPGGFKWHIRNLFSMQLSGWEVSHIMSETSLLFFSSQAGMFPMAHQKPPCCSPGLRPGGFPGHVRNLLFFCMQLSVREVSHIMAETSLLFPSPQTRRLPRARQKPPCCSPALRSGGMCGQKAASVVVVGPSFILLLPRRRDSPGCWGRGGVCAPRDGRLPWDTSTRKAASRPLSCRFSPPRCSWPCPSAVPSHKGFPNPSSGLAWICSSEPHRELRGNGVKERLGLQAGH